MPHRREKSARVDHLLAGLEEMPPLQLHELVDQLDSLRPDELVDQPAEAQMTSHGHRTLQPADNAAGMFTTDSLLKTLEEAGLTGLADLLTFCGLREELSQLFKETVTILAPTNTALAQLSCATRGNTRLLRQIVFAHVCAGRCKLDDMQRKHCAVAMAGQTHAVYSEGGHTHVGTARFGRTDLEFAGGIVHEVHSVLLVVQLVQDCHAEQVWKKTLQPPPHISICGGGVNQGVGVPVELEVHACLLHVATGQLVPEALVGHLRPLEANSHRRGWQKPHPSPFLCALGSRLPAT